MQTKTTSQTARSTAPKKKPARGYEPPKLVKFDKLERLIVSGE